MYIHFLSWKGGQAPRFIPPEKALSGGAMSHPENAADKNRVCVLPPVRCTAKERDQIKERAAATGKSQSAYLREMALSGKVVVKQARADDALFFQLQKIGVNLNQMTKEVRATGTLPPVALSGGSNPEPAEFFRLFYFNSLN
jgi:hypothetical protein